MPFHKGEFQATRSEAYASLLSGLYGEEHDGKLEELVELENGARDFWAGALREKAETAPQDERAGLLRAADLLDPYTPKHTITGAGFARTELDDRPEGCKWVRP